LTALVQ